jgi:TP901 family phage tail tape measure protein
MGMIGSIGEVVYKIFAEDGTGPGADSATKKMAAVGAAMTGVGVGAKLMVDDVNASFLEFDGSMTAVKALGAMSEEEFGKMKDAAIDLSTQVPVSATDVSDAMYKMVSVGYDFDTMMATIPEATKLAVGGNQELSESVDTVINVMGAYGTEAYTAADITNILAKSVGVGKWELGDFTTEMQKNVGVAAQLGMSFEDTAAANVLLQNKFTSAEEAGTAFKTMLLRLVDPKVQEDLVQLGVNVKDSEGNFVGMESVLTQLGGALGNMGGETSKAAVDLKSLGVSAFDSSGKFVGMSKVTADLNEVYSRTGALTPELSKKIESLGFKIDEKTGKITLSKKATKEYDEILGATGGNVDKMATLQKIFGTEGLRAAMALVEEKDKLKGMSAEMNDATFKENAYNTVVQSTGAQLEISKNKMEAAKIMMGEAMAPATSTLAGLTADLAGSIMMLPKPLQEVAGMGLFAAQGLAALGPLLMGLAALKGLGLAGTLGSVATGISGLGTSSIAAIAALGPLAPILAGLALGLAAVYAMKELGVFDWVYDQGAAFGGWLDETQVAVQIWQNNTASDFLAFKNNASQTFAEAGQYIANGAGTISASLGGLVSSFAGIGSSLGSYASAAFSGLGSAFYAMAGQVQGIFSQMFSAILGLITGTASGFYNAGMNIITNIVNGILAAAGGIVSAIGGALQQVRALFPFSPAKEGPLAETPNWGTWATYGMDGAATEIAAAAETQLAAPVAQATSAESSDLAASGGASSGTSAAAGGASGPITIAPGAIVINGAGQNAEEIATTVLQRLADQMAAKRTQLGYRSTS